jgi:hypothetical protein
MKLMQPSGRSSLYLLRGSQGFHPVFHLRVMPTPTPLHTVSQVPPRRGTRVT